MSAPLLLGLFLLILTEAARAEVMEEPGPSRSIAWLLEEAGQAYQAGEYEKAGTYYEEALEQGAKNGYLYYNLGNAYQRQGKVGEAILNYRIAALYLPRDGNVEANLRYARGKAQDRVEKSELPGWRRVIFWYDELSDFELAVLTLALNALCFGLLMAAWAKRGASLRLPALVAGVLALLLGATAVHRAYSYSAHPDGVILSEEVSVRSGTDVSSVSLFVLHAGTEVLVDAPDSGAWIRISLPDGKRGWVEREWVGLVRP